MPRISVIVPVYNTAKYISKCLNSIMNQTMEDFEVIVVNDGSTDSSEEIIEEFAQQNNDERIRYFKKENGGLSDARNFGVQKAVGDYLCFVDSDDYIQINLFEKLEKFLAQEPDLIKFKCVRVNEQGEIMEKVNGPVFGEVTGEQGFNALFSNDVYIEPAWLYLYKKDYYIQNNFEFPVNRYHEDWALIPYILLNAKSFISTDIYGYYYVQSTNSITRNNDDEKILKRSNDMLHHYDNLIQKISTLNLQKQTIDNYKIYMTNCLILKINELPVRYHKQYIKELNDRRLVNNIKPRNFKQFVKKLLLKINIKFYLKIRSI